MKKIVFPFIALLLSLSPVMAENWIALPTDSSAQVDTDSYVDSGIRSSIALSLALPQGKAVSVLEFGKDNRAYRVAEVKTFTADGKMKDDTTYSDDADSWSPLLPNSFGKNVYTHFVEYPLPHFTHPVWLNVYKEDGVKYHGSTYDIEKNTISYKNGYATFWLRIAYPWKDQDFSAVIYQVKMDIPNKRVQTLSMTEYGFDGKVKSHGAGSNERTAITPDTPMAKVHQYLKTELEAGRIKMVSTKVAH